MISQYNGDIKMAQSNEKDYKSFVLYFEELNEQGISYGLSDMFEKAVELELPVPIFDKKFKQVGWKWKDGKVTKEL